MKITTMVLSLAIAAAAGSTTMVSSDNSPATANGLPGVKSDSSDDSRICRWLGRSDSDSMVRLWFACRS